ncbi:MAG: hypothetical protein H6Q21_2390 [Bacteroidetes bacterium]|jgi:hypothetical protein|nr:hypothetical protein [Bacteroidota bacterium]
MEHFTYQNLEYPQGLILVREFKDKVNVDLIIESWEYLLTRQILTGKHIGVINDLCRASLDMNMDSFSRLIHYLKANPFFSKIKLAVICDTPNKIVFPMIGEYNIRELKIRPFTTLEKSIEWILEDRLTHMPER